MGLLVDGAWQEDSAGKEFGSRTTDGHFVRKATAFHNYITADGSPGPTGKGGFPAERGRYHLYVALACPWAHRTLIFRKLKKLEDMISVSITVPLFGKQGWEFGTKPGATLDTVNGKPAIANIYVLVDPHYTGRASVPVLWDKAQRVVVNNESSEIIRMLNSDSTPLRMRTDYYPSNLRPEIDGINDVIYATVTMALSRRLLYDTGGLRRSRLGAFRHARQVGGAFVATALSCRTADQSGLAPVHHAHSIRCGLYSHFKCKLRRIVDYPSLSNYLRDLYQVPALPRP